MAYVIEGFEENVQTLQSYPVLTIAQSQTPEISEGNIPGLRIGSLMNSVSKQPLPDKLELVAYRIWNGRLKLPARGEGSAIECFSPDGFQGMAYGKCAQCQYADFNLKDACKKQIVFMVSPVDEPSNIMRIIFWKSNYTVGNKLLSSLRNECARKKAKAIYEVSFNISTKKVKNEAAGAYYWMFQTEMGDKVSEDIIPQLRENFELITDLRKQNLDNFYANLTADSDDAEGISPAGDRDLMASNSIADNPDALM